MNTNYPPLTGGRTFEEWNHLWIPVPYGLKYYQAHLTNDVGLYRYVLNGRVMALGLGTDSKGGIAKRLSDFIRPGWSGRDHHAGQLIHAHRDQLVVEVLITGSGPEAQAIARQLKDPMVELHSPPWNVLADVASIVGKESARRRAIASRTMPQPGPQRQSPVVAGASTPVFA
jgi:hypothetical protein